MTTRTLRAAGGAAIVLWLVVAGYAVRELIVADGGDDWELAYAVLATALPIAIALIIAVLRSVTSGAGRSGLRIAGLAVSVLGCAFAAIAAWAVPVWMTLLGLGLGLLAVATTGSARRPIGLLALAAGFGLATQFSLLAFDASEDVAADVALLLVAAATVVALGSGFRRVVPAD